MMLAATYSDGVAVFHVSVPQAKEQLDSEAKSVQLEPFAVARLSRPGGRNTSVTWLSLGPHASPYFAVLSDGGKMESECSVVLCMIDLPHYTERVSSDDIQRCPIRAVCETRLPRSRSVSGEQPSSGLFALNSIGSIACNYGGRVLALSPALSSSHMLPATDDAYFLTLKHPVASQPSGLDSVGSISLPDSSSDKAGILSVFTMTQCDPQPPSSEAGCQRECWSVPVQRHWLCRTHVGDSNDSRDVSVKSVSEPKTPSLVGNENATCGSTSSVVCELRCGDMSSSSTFVPHRIVRCKSSGHCAVLFASTLGDTNTVASRGVAVDPSIFALLDSDSSKRLPSIDYRKGRDVAFLPKGDDDHTRALILSEDGSSIHLLTCQEGDGDESEWREGAGFRPFLGAPSVADYSECRRVFVVSSGSWSGLLMVGTRVRDGQTFIVCSKLINPIDSSQINGLSTMLPNLKTDPLLWLGRGECVVSLAELPRFENGRRCIAVGTHQRVIIADLDTLTIFTETSVALACGSLASIGSHTVSFCSTDSRVQYLCGLPGKFSRGVLAALPSPACGTAPNCLLAVRPDRIVFATTCNGVRLVQQGENEHMCLTPSGRTKPAILLEPLVANALCERDNKKYSDEIIRLAIEKFGRKTKSLAHAENEGIGNLGCGLTPMVFEMLSAHGFKHPASWLLAGNTRVEPTSNCKILPPWAPMPSKAHAALGVDSLLQIAANGDQYFSDYVKSPDQSMASNLPRTSDPSAEFALEFGRKAMAEGKIREGLRLLDVAGTEPSNGDLLHLVLSLQLDPFSDITKVLKALCGYDKDGSTHLGSYHGATTSLAALSLDLRMRGMDGRELPKVDHDTIRASGEVCRRRMRQLAPSVQRGYRVQRSRHRLIGDNAFELALTGHKNTMEPEHNLWDAPFNESNHVW